MNRKAVIKMSCDEKHPSELNVACRVFLQTNECYIYYNWLCISLWSSKCIDWISFSRSQNILKKQCFALFSGLQSSSFLPLLVYWCASWCIIATGKSEDWCDVIHVQVVIHSALMVVQKTNKKGHQTNLLFSATSDRKVHRLQYLKDMHSLNILGN